MLNYFTRITHGLFTLKKMNKNFTDKGLFAQGNTIGKQYQKGVSGNPKGKPKGTKNLMTVIREIANQPDPDRPSMSRFAANITKTTEDIKKIEDILKNMDKEHPYYATNIKKLIDIRLAFSDHILKSSGDYTTKTTTVSDEDKRKFSSVKIIDGEKTIELK